MIVHEHVNHVLFEIELFVCFVLCLHVLHSWKKKKSGHLVSFNLEDELASNVVLGFYSS